MAKASFSELERAGAGAVAVGEALVAFKIDGRHLLGFPYKSFEDYDTLPPEMAQEAVEWFAAFMKRAREGKAKPVTPAAS